MSVRALVALVLALAAVVGVLLWLQRGKAPSTETPAAAPLASAFEEADVQEMRASCGEHAWRLVHAGEHWSFVEPVRAEADPRRVHDLITAVQDARVRKVVATDGFDPGAFALAPGCRLDVALAAGGARTIRLGRTSPVGSDRYALGEQGQLVLTDGTLYGLVDREAAAWRERRLVPFEAETATKLVIERPEGRLALVTAPEGWRMAEPLSDQASTSACTRLAGALAALSTEDAGDATPPSTAKDARRIAIEVTTRGAATPRRVYVATAGIGGKRLAWRDDRSLVGLVSESALHDLDLEPDAYRDRKVVSFSTPDVRSVRIERGGNVLTVSRASESAPWTGADNGTPFDVDRAPVDTLLDRLRSLAAEGFVPDAAPGSPTGTIVVGGGGGELARLRWGPLPPEPGTNGERVWVATPKRPGVVFRVAATALGAMPSKASEWTARTAPPGKAP